MKILNLIAFFSIIALTSAYANNKNGNEGTTIDSLNAENLNWQNKDLKIDKIVGASVEKAYNELLVNKTPEKKIIVAVIDGGVDIYHEDLEGKIWKNTDEIEGNGIDDDNNGYIDDMHGWNFLGNASGENVIDENLEYVRIINSLKGKYDSVPEPDKLTAEEKKDLELYNNCKEKYDSELKKYTNQKKGIENFQEKLKSSAELLEPKTKTLKPTLKDLENISADTKEEKDAIKFFKTLFKRGFSYSMLSDVLENNANYLTKHLNFDLNARSIINDKIDDYNDAFYGNSDVKGERSFHGTFVAGVIGANRNNDMGINGIANNIEIMVLRTVPDGDEYDKDVALSIKYAVDNGANVINMSFGKDYSPQKELVDKAIKYAEEKGVLLVHAAGNAAENNDIKTHYPDKKLNNGNNINNWITVGANSNKKNKKLPGVFSNYGKETVDIFAPGVDIISLAPESKYKQASGTSFSAPVVSGVAALVWSYYPSLSVTELKEVLLQSTTIIKNKVLVPNVQSPKKSKTKFTELSATGGVVNAYNALQLAAEKTGNKATATK